MIDTKDATSTRPYLIRALYEWCTDNGFTPFISVSVNETVRVPMEFVRNGEIVLNISYDATSSLSIGNEVIEFKGRFGGVAKDIFIPVDRVSSIYARENGQGMAFPAPTPGETTGSVAPPIREAKPQPLASVASSSETDSDDSNTPRPSGTGRPSLKRIK
jgi:stringent starvation protein B